MSVFFCCSFSATLLALSSQKTIQMSYPSEKQVRFARSLFWRACQIKMQDFDANSWERKSENYWQYFLAGHPEFTVDSDYKTYDPIFSLSSTSTTGRTPSVTLSPTIITQVNPPLTPAISPLFNPYLRLAFRVCQNLLNPIVGVISR